MQLIKIGKPYVINAGEVSRLEAVIKGPDYEKIHYFEVQREYGKYLCYERCDAFVVSLLYYAMVNGFDIECDTPISEKLYYQLTRVLVPSMVRYHKDIFHDIKITAQLDNHKIDNHGAVGTAVSGGVDSFYTIITNLNTEVKDFNITHLLVANSFNYFEGDKNTRIRFAEIADNSQAIADELHLPLIRMLSNHSEFWFKNYQSIFAMKYASYPLALQKLFAVYYFASGYEYADFSMTTKDLDSSHYDALSVPQASNENFSFILIGGEATRSQKISRIMDNGVVQRHLQVCNIHTENCSKCEKCMRTQMTLYGFNRLQYFNKSFNLNEFEKEKNKTIVRMLMVRTPFDVDNLRILREHNIRIPFKIRCLGQTKRFLYMIKQRLKRNRIIYATYRRLVPNKTIDELDRIEKYNTNKQFAKACDSGIV